MIDLYSLFSNSSAIESPNASIETWMRKMIAPLLSFSSSKVVPQIPTHSIMHTFSPPQDRSGTTAVCSIVTPSHIILVNLGELRNIIYDTCKIYMFSRVINVMFIVGKLRFSNYSFEFPIGTSLSRRYSGVNPLFALLEIRKIVQ